MNLKRSSGNLYEYFVTSLISVGLPLVAWVYLDWRAAFGTFVVANILLGIFALRGSE